MTKWWGNENGKVVGRIEGERIPRVFNDFSAV
jgi:hypothetical protein